MTKKKKTRLFSLIYIGVTIIAIILIALLTDVNDIAEAFKSFSVWWLAACLGALLLYWLTDGLLLHDITAYMYKREPLLRSLKIGIIGLYYGAVTPFATGGQPMQVLYMKRNKIPVGTATCIVCIKFVIYELSLCAIYVVAMIARGIYYYTNYNEVFWLATLGFAINLAAVCFIILTIINKRLVLRFGGWLIRVFARIKVVKDKEKTMVNFEGTIDDYHTAASYISRYKLRAIGSFLISFVNLAFFFVIPYFLYLAFGNREFDMLHIFTMQAFVYLAVSFFPTPGGSGAAEGGFLLFFRPFFGASTYIAMMIWRFFTYFMMLIVGSLIVVFNEVLAMRRVKKESVEEIKN